MFYEAKEGNIKVDRTDMDMLLLGMVKNLLLLYQV